MSALRLLPVSSSFSVVCLSRCTLVHVMHEVHNLQKEFTGDSQHFQCFLSSSRHSTLDSHTGSHHRSSRETMDNPQSKLVFVQKSLNFGGNIASSSSPVPSTTAGVKRPAPSSAPKEIALPIGPMEPYKWSIFPHPSLLLFVPQR